MAYILTNKTKCGSNQAVQLVFACLAVFLLLVGTKGWAQVGPAGIGSNNIIWLEANDLPLTLSDGFSWPDKTAHGFDAIDINDGSTTPTIVTINGQQYLRFAGVAGEQLVIADDHGTTNLLDGAGEFSVVVVFNTGSTDTRALLSKRRGSRADERSWSMLYNSGFNMFGYANTTVAGGSGNVGAAGNPYVATMTVNSALTSGSVKMFVNSEPKGSTGATVSIPDRAEDIYIGLFNSGDPRYFDGDIAEIIVYRDALSNPDRLILENYLGQKYGISIINDYFGNGAEYDNNYVSDLRGIGSDGTHTRTNSLASGGLTLRENSGSLDPNEYVTFAHNNIAHAEGVTTNLADVNNVTSRWNRDWYVEVNRGGGPTGASSGDVGVSMVFDFGVDASLNFSGSIADYVLLYRSASTGNFDRVYADSYTVEEGNKVVVNVPASRLNTGYYTLGKGSPLLAKTWYVFQDGNWGDASTWTTDASTAPLWKNTAGEIPTAADEVIIRSGRTVTIPASLDNQQVHAIKIDGNLNIETSKGHNFTTINGRGTLRMAGTDLGSGLTDNFPQGNTNGNLGFANKDNGGTVIIDAAGDVTLDVERTFKNLHINLGSATSKVTLASNFTLNGNFKVIKGGFQFGDGTANARTLSVSGNTEVTASGNITTAIANVRHTFTMLGNFVNDGNVRFTNRADFTSDAERREPNHEYYQYEASDNSNGPVTDDGMVDVIFANDEANQVANFRNSTLFYRIVVDKGADKTYKLLLKASNTNYFRLLGFANDDVNSDMQSAAQNMNAFALINGTAEIGGNIEIPVLNRAGNYAISSTTRLWVNGGDVRKTSATAVVPYGTVQVSNGYLEATGNSGLTLRVNGLIQIEGGSVVTNQIRTSVQGSNSLGGYHQSGGNVMVNGDLGGTNNDYYIFSLTYPGNVFIMSGGHLSVAGSNGRGAIFINSDPGNVSVTGGRVTVTASNTNVAKITSRAPFYNVNMRANGAPVGNIELGQGTSGANGGAVTLDAQPLVVINDLLIHGYNDFTQNPLGDFAVIFAAVTSNTSVNDVYIGGSFYVGRFSTYQAVYGGTPPYNDVDDPPTHYNTTYFQQTIATSAIDSVYNGMESGTGVLEMGSFVLDRTSGNELRTVARTGNNGKIRFDVNGDVSVLSGTLDQNAYTFRIWGNITNYDRLGTYYSSGDYPVTGGTPSEAQVRFREDPPLTIKTAENATFGNIRFNVGDAVTVEFDSDVYIERMEYWNGRIYVKNHTLTVDEIWNIDNGDRNFFNKDLANSSIIKVNNEGIVDNLLVFTDGKASDGGLRLKIRSNTVAEDQTSRLNNTSPITFPVGFTPDGGTTFISRPAQMKVKDFVDDGYVQINVVSGELQTSDLAGGEILQHYWRVRHDGFTTLPTVAYRFYYRGSDTVEPGRDRPFLYANSDEDNYVPGYVLDGGTYERHFESDPAEDKTDIFTSTAPSGNQNADENNRTRIITFNGASVGGEFTQSGFVGFPLVNANFTAGVATRFVGAPQIYYTRLVDGSSWYDKAWRDGNNWSFIPHDGTNNNNARPVAGSYPEAGDIAVIGYGGYNGSGTVKHSININNGDIVNVAEIRFENPHNNDSRVVARRDVNLTFGKITGTGGTFMQRLRDNDNPVIAGDFGEFYSKSTFTYAYYLDADGMYTLSPPTAILPNLRVEGRDNRIATFQEDITVNNDFIIDGNGIVRTSDGTEGDILVLGQLVLGGYQGGYLEFSDGQARTIEVGGIEVKCTNNCDGATGGITVANTLSNSLHHRLIVNGNMAQNLAGDINLVGGAEGPTDNKVILELSGAGDHRYTQSAGGIPSLYQVVMNKGSDTTSTFTFPISFNIPVATASFQPVEVLNGTLILDNPGIDITLADGGTNFYLPHTPNSEASSGSGGLEIRQGVTRIQGDNTGMILDGPLRISGGEFTMDDIASNGNNFIEYSSSGEAALNITSGSLIVGSHIRRGTNANTGVLRYSQQGGDVVIGKNAAPLATRGLLEITNAGSSFEYTGGSLTIVRDNNSTTIPSLLVDPGSTNIAAGTVITIGNSDTPANQDRFGIQSSVRLEEIAVVSDHMDAKLYNLPLYSNRLTIETGASFDASGYDVFIYELLANDGVFSTSGNSTNDQHTRFPVTASAAIAGNGVTTFWNLEKSGSGTLTLLQDVTVANNGFIYAGTLDTRDKELSIKKDLLHDAIHTSAPTGPGIVFNGSQQQRLDRSGAGYSQLGVVELNNAAGLIIRDTEENFQINHKLTLSTGVFDMGGNLLIFPTDAFIENGAGGTSTGDFNVNNMIQTNSSIRDFGVRKYYPAVSGGSLTFTYPVGLTAYTPIVVTINDMSAGYITARPVHDIPPIAEDVENTSSAGMGACTDPDITDADNVLQYYWIVRSEGVVGFNGNITAHYDPNDLRVTNPYTVSNYGPARLYNASNAWDKSFTTDDFDEVAHQITYPFTAQSDATVEGVYTAGVTLQNDGNSLLCGAAIPDQVPQFTTDQNGTFFNNLTYIGDVAPIPGETPDITIASGNTLRYDQSSIRTRKILIEAGATLILQDGTNNHNLGFVSGEGKLVIESNGTSALLPSGDYERFFPDATCSGGGILEYTGSGSYSILSDVPAVRQVILSGSGRRTLPNNTTIRICEDLDIEGSVDVVIPDSNTKAIVLGDVHRSDASSFDNGGGTLTLAGKVPQSIEGDFTAGNALGKLEIANGSGVTVVNTANASRGISGSQDIEIEEELIFTSGLITTDADNALRMLPGATARGYGSTRYVNGPLQANLNDNDNFAFPVGKGGRYGLLSIAEAIHSSAQTLTWQAEYFNSSAETDGRVSSLTASSDPDILSISKQEYWVVTDDKGTPPAGAVSATIGLRWDADSDAPHDINTLATMVWNGSEWDNYGGTNHAGNPSTGTFLSSMYVPFSEKVITMGSTEMAVLPVEILSFRATAKEQTVQLIWETISEINNDYFEVLRSVDGIRFKKIGEVAGAGNSNVQLRYEFVDRLPIAGVAYYQLKQVDYNGMYDFSDKVSIEWVQGGEHATFVELNLYPNPAPQGEAKLRVTGLQPHSVATVKLLDMFGHVHLQQHIEAEQLSKDGYVLRPRARLAAGVYVVSVQQGDRVYQKTLILR